MRKIVTIDPIPEEGDWSIGSKGTAMVITGSLKVSSIYIEEVEDV